MNRMKESKGRYPFQFIAVMYRKKVNAQDINKWACTYVRTYDQEWYTYTTLLFDDDAMRTMVHHNTN